LDSLYTKRHHKSYFSVGRLAEATRLLDWRVSPTTPTASTGRPTRPAISNPKFMMTLGIVSYRLEVAVVNSALLMLSYDVRRYVRRRGVPGG